MSNETKFSKYFNLPNPGLRSYFDRVVKGQPEVYRSTFAKGKSTSQVLKEWLPHLKSIQQKWPSLFEFENDLASKVGPMSVMKPLAERMKDIDHYYEDIKLDQVPISDEAIAHTIRMFSKSRGIRVRDQKHTIEKMQKSTNSGSPYFSKRRTVIDKTYPCNVYYVGDDIQQDLHMSEDEDTDDLWYGAAVLGWRGQEGGPKPTDVKQRVVWMFPFAVNIKELQVYQPLIESCQKTGTVPAWISMDAVDKEITLLFDSKDPDDLIICTDFSKFDQHFNETCQNAAKAILTALLTKDIQSSNWLHHIFPIKYMIPLAYDYGKIRKGKHGMGSGSGGTNADETLVHKALQYEAALSSGKQLNPHSQCLGDDGILTYPGIKVDDVIRSYTSHGLEMNPDKQYVSKQDCVYLRRWHHQNYRVEGVCVGVYSTCRALGRLMEQERYYDPDIWSAKMVALRQLSILENVKYHPLKEEFVEFCMKRDKYRLGLDIPGFLDNIASEAKTATDLMPDFLGYTKSMQKDIGIENWWIVKYLKSKL
nr:MAG: RNA-dependent RNA polymerase [Porcine picobirnavirus]